MNTPASLVLASASPARRAMLENAGLALEVLPGALDETAARRSLAGRQAPEIASALACEKALACARRAPARLVLGADQILVCRGKIFAKPASLAEARCQLQELRGKTHELISAAALARDGAVLWQGKDGARLTMRAFSDEFLDTYLASLGGRALLSVGAYQLEGLGAQLMERVEGDYFTILGLPMLAVLAALRDLGALAR